MYLHLAGSLVVEEHVSLRMYATLRILIERP